MSSFFSALALILIFSGKALAFDYFGSKIDYWGDSKKKEVPTIVKESATQEEKKPVNESPSSSFDWKKQLDPKNDDFFKEGDYTPPAAFMELARNPTDQNITNWFKLIEKKNEIQTRLSQRMQQYLSKNSKLVPAEKQVFTETAKGVAATDVDYSRYRFRMYFESSCPHCKHMMETMKELQDSGFYVEIKQIDQNSKVAQALPFQ
jgi:thiol-disulfide isomerase/thioredoxin